MSTGDVVVGYVAADLYWGVVVGNGAKDLYRERCGRVCR